MRLVNLGNRKIKIKTSEACSEKRRRAAQKGMLGLSLEGSIAVAGECMAMDKSARRPKAKAREG